MIGTRSVRACSPDYAPSAARRRLSKWSPNSFSAAAPLPENDAPCMVAKRVGLSSASLRIVGAVVGPRLVGCMRSSMAMAGPMISPDVSAEMGEQVPAEKCVRRLLKYNARIPAVRNVWRVDVAEALAADIDNFSIREHARRAISHIRDRNTATNHAVRKLGLRRSR